MVYTKIIQRFKLGLTLGLFPLILIPLPAQRELT